MSGVEFLVAVAILVVGGVLLAASRRIFQYVVDAVAAALVKSINGQLGLDAIRDDVSAMKRQVEDVPAMRTQIENLEGQIEAILTDGQ